MMAAARWLRVLAGSAFLLAGIGKLAGERGVRMAPLILGEAGAALMAASAIVEDALPGLECVVGAALLAGAGRFVALVLGWALSGAFVAAALAIPTGVRCGCFGLFGGFEDRRGHLAVATALFLLISILWAAERRTQGPIRGTPRMGRSAGTSIKGSSAET